MNSRATFVAANILSTALAGRPVIAETEGGAPLADGDNGAAAEPDANRQAQASLAPQGDASRGSAAPTRARGQSKEHSDGTMHADENL